jgi:hypothetical protein
VDRLVVGEHVHDAIVRVAQQHLQGQPPRLVEVLGLVDDERDELRTERVDRPSQERRQLLVPEFSRSAIAGSGDGCLPAHVEAQLMEARDLHTLDVGAPGAYVVGERTIEARQ